VQIGEVRVAQIEFPLDPTACLILQLAEAVEVVDLLPFRCDPRKLDLVVELGDGFTPKRVRRSAHTAVTEYRWPKK
jgi:hypothetical protein